MDLRDVFEEMDKTGDANGKLDQSEFTAGLQKVEPYVSDHEAANQFKMADTPEKLAKVAVDVVYDGDYNKGFHEGFNMGYVTGLAMGKRKGKRIKVLNPKP